jgi:hypothetical protein
MTESEINRAIAESVGWKWFDHPDVRERTKTWTLQDKWIQTPTGELVFPHNVPNYHGDLNAIQRTVMLLSRDGVRSKYNQMLMDSLQPTEAFILDRTINATAQQRCIAYLRSIDKYKE